jgi:hypothetical protein
MLQARIAEAIQLRETGRAKQDLEILEQARTILLDLAVAAVENAEITFQLAVCHDNMGRSPEAVPYYVQALS